MSPLDPASCFAISACSALVGAVMLRLEHVPDARMRGIVDTWATGLAVLGMSLGIITVTGPMSPPWAEFLMLTGVVAAIPILTHSLGELLGVRWASRRNMLLALLVITAVQALAGAQGGRAPGIAHAVLSVLATFVMSAAAWPFLARPRSYAEFSAGLCGAFYTLSWVVRAAFTLTWTGDVQPFHLYLPDALIGPYSLLYGTLPAVLATLLMNLQNDALERQLAALAATDELTGALVRREVRERARQALNRRRAGDHALALMMIDLDAFKSINDRHGHPAGDRVLRHTADLLRSQLRGDALLGRYGGEEFVVMVGVESVAAARLIAERLREGVALMPCRLSEGAQLRVTVSIGVALVGESEELDAAVARADEALYRAKHGGRDRVEMSLIAAA